MNETTTRRGFLVGAPLAAASLLALHGAAVEAEGLAPADLNNPFAVFPKSAMDGMVSGFETKPGSKDLVAGRGMALTMTVSAETAKSGKEFEYHERRDHVFQVLDGSTVYEVGGTPQGARQVKPGEWLAPSSEGATRVVLQKGDYLSIPRNTPHKRMTEGTVSLLLISAGDPS